MKAALQSSGTIRVLRANWLRRGVDDAIIDGDVAFTIVFAEATITERPRTHAETILVTNLDDDIPVVGPDPDSEANARSPAVPKKIRSALLSPMAITRQRKPVEKKVAA